MVRALPMLAISQDGKWFSPKANDWVRLSLITRVHVVSYRHQSNHHLYVMLGLGEYSESIMIPYSSINDAGYGMRLIMDAISQLPLPPVVDN